jgi:hypothetical protein
MGRIVAGYHIAHHCWCVAVCFIGDDLAVTPDVLLFKALGYMIISPVINGLACSTFFAFYMMYKYLFVWEFGQPPSSDTGGLYFPKAIQQLFVGLYVQQVSAESYDTIVAERAHRGA